MAQSDFVFNGIDISGTSGTTITLPSITGTIPLNNQIFYIGTQAIAINAGSGTITSLPGVTSINGTIIPSSATLVISGANSNITSLTGLTTALSISQGGTGATTASAAAAALLPSQTSNSGKYLTTDGTNASWATVATSSNTIHSFAMIG